MDPESLAHLIDRHAGTLVLYARQWCASSEDVVQEAFVKLAARSAPPANCAAWLYRVVRNGAISAGRAERRRRNHETHAGHERGCWFQQTDTTGLDADEATRALQQVPLATREIIIAHLWGGLTFEQIAPLAGCSSSTAHRRYQEGLVLLRERLGVICPINTNKPT